MDRPRHRRSVSPEEAAALSRAAFAIFRRWTLTDERAAAIAGVKVADLDALRTGAPPSEATTLRFADLLGIHAALRTIFRETERCYAWVKAPNAAFGGASALDLMGGDDLAGVERVLRHLLEEVERFGAPAEHEIARPGTGR